MKKIKAFQLLEKGKKEGERGITGWVEIDAPVCPEHGAICRPVAVASCTSDVHGIRTQWVQTPMPIGHETVGEVVEVGAQVRDFKPGDRVIITCNDVDPHDYQILERDPKFVLNPATVGGGRSWAELFLVNDADFNMAHVPDSVTNLQAVMVPDMMSTAFAGVKNANIQLGDTVVVVGIGPVGLMAVAGCALQGAGRIFAIGSRKSCVELAYNYGATKVLNYKDGPIPEQILAANGGNPVDAVIVAGGNDPSVVGEAFKYVKRGGNISNIAAFLDMSKNFVIESADFYFGCNDAGLRGCCVANGRPWLERLLAIVESGRVDPTPLSTHIFHGFDSLPETLAAMEDKNDALIKSVALIEE